MRFSTMSIEYCDVYNAMFSTSTEHQVVVPPVKKFDKNEAINDIRTLLNTKAKNVAIPQLSDDMILRFLHARKMNVETSFQLILNYFAFRNSNPTLFRNLSINDELIQSSLHDGLPFVLRNKDRKGRCVLLFLVYQWDHAKYTIDTVYRSLVTSMEYLLADTQNQVNGFVFVVDWTNFKLRDYIDISPKMLKLMIDGFQDSFPAKIKGIHFIGQPWYVDGILTVVKSFVKEKTKQKLIVHGTNLNQLHEYLPRDVVTPELGGEGSAYKPDEWIELLKNYESSRSKE